MKTLEQIKNEYSHKSGFTNKTFIESLSNWDNEYQINDYIDGLLKIYAMECLKLASEKYIIQELPRGNYEVLPKNELTNENNIIK